MKNSKNNYNWQHKLTGHAANIEGVVGAASFNYDEATGESLTLTITRAGASPFGRLMTGSRQSDCMVKLAWIAELVDK